MKHLRIRGQCDKVKRNKVNDCKTAPLITSNYGLTRQTKLLLPVQVNIVYRRQELVKNNQQCFSADLREMSTMCPQPDQ